MAIHHKRLGARSQEQAPECNSSLKVALLESNLGTVSFGVSMTLSRMPDVGGEGMRGITTLLLTRLRIHDVCLGPSGMRNHLCLLRQ